MKALILNSGLGSRMGVLTSEHPKCMTEVSSSDTILSRQLRQLAEVGIREIVMTTGAFDSVLVNYCRSLKLPLHYTFVKNPIYAETNYIYSICCAAEYLDDDILMMHGDLVFENEVLDLVLASEKSCMTVSSTIPLPDKDFKAVVRNGCIEKIGIEFFTDAAAAQPLYKINRRDWKVWLNRIIGFCNSGQRKCYAENAFNDISAQCPLLPLDVRNMLCGEIDNPQDLAVMTARVAETENRTVYLCFSTDILHSGHLKIIKKSRRLGRLIVGILDDDAVAEYRHYPILPCEERMEIFRNIVGVHRVVVQKTLSYRENLEKYRPTYVVHGDDWLTGIQRPIREEVLDVLSSYGGRLVEYPYAHDLKYRKIESFGYNTGNL